jgi:hypothetical protein
MENKIKRTFVDCDYHSPTPYGYYDIEKTQSEWDSYDEQKAHESSAESRRVAIYLFVLCVVATAIIAVAPWFVK